MITLCIRTDKPTSELYVFNGSDCIASEQWEAHRSLAETIHKKIDELLKHESLSLKDIEKVVIFQGPGSFTGLRIGMSVVNALGFALQIPVIAAQGEDWLSEVNGATPGIFIPQVPIYGADPHITQQKK